MAYDTAWETVDLEEMVPREPLRAQSIEFNPILCYIPKQLWPQMYKTFILGYGGVMKAIAQLLARADPVLPTEAAVRGELQNGQIEWEYVRAAQFYFQKGGRVEYALDAVLDSAKNNFDLEGTDLDIYADDEKYLKTPPCDNDREFDIVRKKMGLDPVHGWGPYSMAPARTHWGMDSDDSGQEQEEEDEEDEEEESYKMDGIGNSDEEAEDDDEDVDMEE